MTNKIPENWPPDLANLFAALQKRFGPRARPNEPLAGHTTLRLGGPADIWFPARGADELMTATRLADIRGVPVFMLGGGANLLIRDGGIAGLVIQNQADAVRFGPNGIIAESGISLPRLANLCAKRGLSGLEWAVGIPGTLGGAVVNNAGAYGYSMANCLLRAELLGRDGNRAWQPADWFEYGYRTSKLKQGASSAKPIVLRVELHLPQDSGPKIAGRMQAYTERRKAGQPSGATVGSMFKNPTEDFAGRLIEAAGLKGYRRGQAQISPVHANFFVNLGRARAGDILHLIETARAEVRQQFGVSLELEIGIIGRETDHDQTA